MRRVCPECKTAYAPSPNLLNQVGLTAEIVNGRPLCFGRGCATCNQSGYKGRLGVYEWLRITDGVRDLIGERAPTLLIRQKAVEQGMRTLREDGLRAVFDGKTTIEEVVKYT